MRYLLFFILGLSITAAAYPQSAGNAKGNVFALVIGISSYQDTRIPQLQFADKDARVFADYLRSKAGGSVPEDHIRVLINEDATSSAVYDALAELVEKCKKGDLVFFYFSGHGYVENTSSSKNGFLICFDSPAASYPALALRINELNQIANTLSAQTGAKVVLITDACHSGKLVGNINGANLVGDQLRAVENKEVRITSCADNQLSTEMKYWGGGRGVFSYYLVNGLRGLADQGNDGFVTLDEISAYLASSFKNDTIIKKEKIDQTPVVKGNGDFVLASVNTLGLEAAQKEMQESDSLQKEDAALPVASVTTTPADPINEFMVLLKNQYLELIAVWLNTLPTDDIPFAIIRQYTGNNERLENYLKNDKNVLQRFNSRLAVAFDERGQQVITDYLGSNAAELEKRMYYKAKDHEYDVYAQMFAVALKLAKPGSYLANNIQVKLHYFTGVAERLKMVTVEDPIPLYKQALAEQQHALSLEEHAACIYNELGILSAYTRDYTNAKKYYDSAISASADWAIPWSNLAQLYANTGEYDKGIEAAETALALQPQLQVAHVNLGILYEKKGNMLMAEELLRQAVEMNTRDYFAYEHLGYVYMNTTAYALADSFFIKANDRKEKLPIFKRYKAYAGSGFMSSPPLTCDYDHDALEKLGSVGEYLYAMSLYYNNDIEEAKNSLKKAIAIDKKNPLASHYLGRILYDQKRWPEAELAFNMAIANYLGGSRFMDYANSAFRQTASMDARQCLTGKLEKFLYGAVEDRYFLAKVYENWGHVDEAMDQYRKIISASPGFIGGYYKLSGLLEKKGLYPDAEKILHNYYERNKTNGGNELGAFYKRATGRYQNDAEWQYRAGGFLYQLAASDPYAYPKDKKLIMQSQEWKMATTVNETYDSLPGTNEYIRLGPGIQYPRNQGLAYLLKADSLGLSDDNAVTDAKEKIGDLYMWMASPGKACMYYEQAARLNPANASLRMKLADAYSAAYQLSGAMRLLDSLRNRNEINFPQLLLLSQYYIHSARFAGADSLLTTAKQMNPYADTEIIMLQAKLQFMSGHTTQALEYYKQLLASDQNNYFYLYTIARIYAKLGDSDEAWKWLRMSIEKGFRLGYVLNYDPCMNELRKSPNWDELLKQYHVPKYEQ